MQLACSVCGTYVEIGGGREMRPSLPFVCKSCRANSKTKDKESGAAAPQDRPTPQDKPASKPASARQPEAPQPPAVTAPTSGPRTPKAPLVIEAATPPPPESIEPEVVSLRELEMILSPGVEPPPLDPANAKEHVSKSDPWEKPDEPGASVAPARKPPPLPPPRRAAPSSPELSGAPPLPPPRRAPSSPELSAAPPRRAAPSTPDPEPKAASPAPPPAREDDYLSAGESAADGKPVLVDRSIFRVDSIPPPRVSVRDDDIPIDVDAPVDSGLSDLRSLTRSPAHESRRSPPRRADDAVLNLSGGLFGGNSPLVTPIPSTALTPPVLSAVPANAPAAKTSPLAPVAAASLTELPSASPDRRRLVFGALAVAAAAGVVAVFFAVSGAGGGQAASPADDKPTTAQLDARSPSESAPSRPSPGSASDREPSLDDEPSSSAAPQPSAAPSAAPAAPTTSPAALTKDEPRRTPTGSDRPSSAAPSRPGSGAAAPSPAPAPTPTAAPAAGGGAPFNRAAAIGSLGAAAASAAMSCKKDQSGGAKVSVTFAPSGRVTSARVESGPFVGTPTGGCIASIFRGARVPPFDGGPVVVSKQVNIR